MEEGLEKEVLSFIRQRLGQEVPKNIKFFDGSGVNGLDAEAFMEDFAERYKINMSEFKPRHYYTQEGEIMNLPLNIYRALFKRHELPSRTFDVDHLCKVIKQGKWFDPSE